MTFSIVARQGSSYGVAVASKFLAVGSVVPQVRLEVGGVATQAFAKVSYRADVLRLLELGVSATEAVERVTAADEGRAERQLGVVSASGQATFTGAECNDWAGGVAGEVGEDGTTTRYAIQGNILVGEQVVTAMQDAFLEAAGQPLARRLVAALLAGDAAGGDARGRQSAALVVASPGAGYDQSGVAVDLRVDDDPAAPSRLVELLDLSDLYFGKPQDLCPLDPELAAEVTARLSALGHTGAGVDEALASWAGVENYELLLVPGQIDGRVLQKLRDAGSGTDVG
ncbi:DUF1028 domain-containing protein [Dermatophilaceae bacterium Soc4.6]